MTPDDTLPMHPAPLQPVDDVEIHVLSDNCCDLLLPDEPSVKRLRVTPPQGALAEHGLSLLVRVHTGGRRRSVLMDTGLSGTCAVHNARLMTAVGTGRNGPSESSLAEVEAVVLSHGHYDHFGGITACLAEIGHPVPVVAHRSAFLQRRRETRPGIWKPMPTLDRRSVAASGGQWRLSGGPATLAGNRVLVTGRVERTFRFEGEAPGLEAQIDGRWAADPFEDDQALAVLLEGKGLVVVSGCAHAGIVNTVEHVRRLTGVDRVHAVMGGFHLGGRSEYRIAPTVQALRRMAPDIIVPMHCSGWKAVCGMAAAMPRALIVNSVGTTYRFSAAGDNRALPQTSGRNGK